MTNLSKINTEELADWANRAAELIQEYADDIESSVNVPTPSNAVIEKSLLEELDRIKSGKPTWQSQISAPNPLLSALEEK